MPEYEPNYLNLQKTTTEGVKPLFQPALNRYIIDNAKEKLVFNQFGQLIKIPTGKTKTISFDKMEPLPVNTTALKEGVTPEGTALTITRVESTPSQYGLYVAVTDEFDFYKHDPSPEVLQLTKRLSDNAGETFDLLTKLVLDSGTNVQYAGGKASLTAITASDTFSVDEVRKAVRTLQNNKGETIDGTYVCVVDPDLAYDIQGDTKWIDVKNYDPKDMYAGEIGKLYNVRFVLSTQDLSVSGASAGVNVHCAYFFAKNAYGSVSPKSNMEMILKNKGSGGTADPLEQRSTAGWKGHHVARILTQGWMVRALCAVSK